MRSEEILTELNRRMDVVMRLLAYKLAEERTISLGAPLLRRLGLTVSEIAEIYGTTRATVSVGLSVAKKKRKTGKKR